MRKVGLFLAGATLAAAVSGLSGCSDVPQHHVKVLKDYGGNVSFLDGPTWQYTGLTVTGTDYWDGRIWIDLPLDRSSEAKEVYQTADGALLVDMNVAFSRGQSAGERKKWFINTTDALGIVKKDVEGIARSVVHNYSNAEILDAELALKDAKLPVYTQIQAELGKAQFNDEYGIDKKSYAVWPGNVSPQLQRLHFAPDTPYDADFGANTPNAERVMDASIARALRGVLASVVQNGTATRLRNTFVDKGGAPISVGGKTGSGDNRFKTFRRGGRV